MAVPKHAKTKRNELIRKLHKEGNGYKRLAKMFDVDWSRIRQIIKAKS